MVHPMRISETLFFRYINISLFKAGTKVIFQDLTCILVTVQSRPLFGSLNYSAIIKLIKKVGLDIKLSKKYPSKGNLQDHMEYGGYIPHEKF